MGIRKFTQKQIRYLWAVGYFKTSPHHRVSESAKTTVSPTSQKESKVEYRSFRKDADARDYLTKYYPDPFVTDESLGMKASLSTTSGVGRGLDIYRKPGYAGMNDLLRHGESGKYRRSRYVNDDLSSGSYTDSNYTYGQALKDMETVFRDHSIPLREPTILTRGLRDKFADKMKEMLANGTIQVGSTITDKAYLSCSLGPAGGWQDIFEFGSLPEDQTLRQVIVKMSLPKGHPVVPGNHGQTELILDKGLSFTVTKVERMSKEEQRKQAVTRATQAMMRRMKFEAHMKTLKPGTPEYKRAERALEVLGNRAQSMMFKEVTPVTIHMELKR